MAVISPELREQLVKNVGEPMPTAKLVKVTLHAEADITLTDLRVEAVYESGHADLKPDVAAPIILSKGCTLEILMPTEWVSFTQVTDLNR